MEGRPVLPGPEEALRDLRAHLDQIAAALDYGAAKAREFFDREDRNKPFDKFLASHLVRYFAKKYLIDTGAAVSDDSTFDMAPVALNGLLMNAGRYRVRIWKSDDGDVPAPGKSEARQRFFQQISIPDDTLPEQPVNVILVWDVTKEYLISDFLLSCPIDGTEKRSSVKYEWRMPLPFLVPGRTQAPVTEDAADGDLDIELDRDKVESEDE